LVEPQNQGRAGTSWEPSHEWWLAEAKSSSRGLRWFTRKPSVTRLSHKAEAEDRAWLSGQNRPDRFRVAGRRKLRGGGHASGSQDLRRGYAKCGRRASIRWCYKDKFPKCPWWECIVTTRSRNTVLSPKTNPLWSLSNSKVSSCR
jgi:hypothetical protein